MLKIVKYLGIVCLAYLVIVIVVAAVETSEHFANLSAEQEGEARKLASQGLVTHGDGSVTPLSPKDAKMMVETCSMLRATKFSDMTPKMLSLLDTCRSQGIGH